MRAGLNGTFDVKGSVPRSPAARRPQDSTVATNDTRRLGDAEELGDPRRPSAGARVRGAYRERHALGESGWPGGGLRPGPGFRASRVRGSNHRHGECDHHDCQPRRATCDGAGRPHAGCERHAARFGVHGRASAVARIRNPHRERDVIREGKRPVRTFRSGATGLAVRAQRGCDRHRECRLCDR